MAVAYVSIGSNVDRERNIREVTERLNGEFQRVCYSPVYETAAVGFDGDPFLNLCARFETDLLPDELNDRLHELEQEMGRAPGHPSFAPRGIDLDLLLYDDLVIASERVTLPRKDIEIYAFVLRPLLDLAPDLVHPSLRKPLTVMAQGMAEDCASLVPVAADDIVAVPAWQAEGP